MAKNPARAKLRVARPRIDAATINREMGRAQHNLNVAAMNGDKKRMSYWRRRVEHFTRLGNA